MHSVTSNAVASALGTVNDDTDRVDISNQVTKYLGVNIVYAYRKSNRVYLSFSGAYTGSPNTGTTVLVAGIPQKYRPKFEMTGFTLLGYNNSQFVATARGSIDENGDLKIQESGWANGTQIRSCLIYFVD